MPEIQSDPDPTHDSEMPLVSLSHGVEVETPEEYKEYSMCRF